MRELALFLSAYVLVFALVFQSLNVNQHRYYLAFLTSFLIGGCQIALMRFVPGAAWTELVATLMGGPFAAVSAMHVHRQHIQLKRPLLCALGLHWGDWHPSVNFHSHHAIEVWRCTRCTAARTRCAAVNSKRPSANANCGADRP